MRIRNVMLVLALSITLGCGGYRTHPGAGGYVSGAPSTMQTTLSQSYDTLVGADSVIQSTGADFLTGKFSATRMPAIRTAFNTLVSSYDTAQQAWLSANQTASAGGTISQTTLALVIGALQTAMTNLATVKGTP